MIILFFILVTILKLEFREHKCYTVKRNPIKQNPLLIGKSPYQNTLINTARIFNTCIV